MWTVTETKGITLRQIYAALAMQGDWANTHYDGSIINNADTLAAAAKEYFKMADAMIEFEKTEKEEKDE